MVKQNQLNIAVTGSNGFLGKRLVEQLSLSGYSVTALSRTANSNQSFTSIAVGSIDRSTNWGSLLKGVDTVIHCAARAHVMDDDPKTSLEKYREINVEGTLRLAQSAIASGVRRLIYVSSIKVNGELTSKNQMFKVSDTPAPIDAYGISKLEAEQALVELAKHHSLEIVIVRPPLIYGPGVKGNIAQLEKILGLGLPLPLGKLSNRRSLVHIDNLIDLIKTCIHHPAAANKTFLVADRKPVSTRDLILSMKRQLRSRSILIPFPIGLLKGLLVLVGKSSVADRLFGSLEIDMSHTCDVLQWVPPIDKPFNSNWLRDPID